MSTVVAFKPKAERIASARRIKKTQAKVELQERIKQTSVQLSIAQDAETKLRNEQHWERERLDKSQGLVEEQRKYWERYLKLKTRKEGSLVVERIYTSGPWLYIETACRPIWNKQTHHVLVKFSFIFKTDEALAHQLGTLQAMLLCGARSSDAER